jgi:DMSO/TMAO reductase YedYZ molybdopterin-dependent catalytic subunit
MRQPEASGLATGAGLSAVGVSEPGQSRARSSRAGSSRAGSSRAGSPRARSAERGLPPGQYVPANWPVLHYGRVPVFDPQTWSLQVFGATESGRDHRWGWDEFGTLPSCRVIADFHCVTKFSIPDVDWEGVPAAALLQAVPPAAETTHVMVWADFGYSANVRIADFAADDTLLATHRNGAELTPEHGYPVRLVVPGLYAWKSVKWVRAVEYLTRDRRGFWEERGYHNTADPWREQRYSYQERPGEGPPL